MKGKARQLKASHTGKARQGKAMTQALQGKPMHKGKVHRQGKAHR
jgi:hypothetical protein